MLVKITKDNQNSQDQSLKSHNFHADILRARRKKKAIILSYQIHKLIENLKISNRTKNDNLLNKKQLEENRKEKNNKNRLL